MANAFAITVDTNAVEIDERRRPTRISFTVTNTSGQALAARARIFVEGSAGADWFRIEGAAGEFIDRDLVEDETHQHGLRRLPHAANHPYGSQIERSFADRRPPKTPAGRVYSGVARDAGVV